ncbi:MAG: hypothetical protein DRI71_06550 [Bacteroidetes bacterium]|nr:MAG: hypothetical protein DRI71_06550 [Bacteroidota bacterium]
MKKLIIFCLLITSLGAFAQNEAEWTLSSQKSGVKVYVRYASCDQQSKVYIKVQNTTGKEVSFTWKEHFVMQDRSADVNSGDIKSLSLAANTTAEGKCGDDQYLILVVNPNDYVSMAGLGFWELEIYELKVQ